MAFVSQYGPIYGSVIDDDLGGSAAVSADGTTIAVGAPGLGPSGTNNGKVNIYIISGGSLSLQATLVPSFTFYTYAGTNYNIQNWGSVVSLSADGNTLAVSGGQALNLPTTAVWVYTRSGTTWTLQNVFTSGSTTLFMLYGAAISLDSSGDNLVVTAVSYVSGSVTTGAMYVYTRSGSTWSLQQGPITPTDGIGSSVRMGNAVDFSGDSNTIAVTSITDNGNRGACWIYIKSGGVWSRQIKLTPNTTTSSNEAPGAAKLSNNGNTLITASRFRTWAYTRATAVWTLKYSFMPGGLNVVSIDGAGQIFTLSSGSLRQAIAYTFDGTIATQFGGILTEAGTPLNNFYGGASAIAENASTLVVGASQMDNPTGPVTSTGAFWVYANLEVINPSGVFAQGVVGNVAIGIGDTVIPSSISASASLGTVTVDVVANQSINVAKVSCTAQLGTAVAAISVAPSLTGVSAQGRVGNPSVLTGTVINVAGAQGLCVSNFVLVRISPTVTISGVSTGTAIGNVTFRGNVSVQVSVPPLNGLVGTVSLNTSNIIGVLGQSATGVLGNVFVATDDVFGVSGVQAQADLGVVTLVADQRLLVSGLTANTYLGNVSTVSSTTIDVSGQSVTGVLGNVFVATDDVFGVSGVQAQADLGVVTITAGAQTLVNGLTLSANLGDVSLNTSNTIGVLGQSVTGVLGNVTVDSDNTVNPLGVQAQADLGVVTLVADQRLLVSGLTLNAYLGDVEVRQDRQVPVTGVDGTATLSTVSVATDGIFGVSGVQAQADLGIVTLVTDQQLSVNGLTANTYLGNVSLNTSNIIGVLGQSATATLNGVFVATDDVFSVSGVQAQTDLGAVTFEIDQRLLVSGLTLNTYLGQVSANESIDVYALGVYGAVFEGIVDATDAMVVGVDGVEAYGILGRAAVWNTINDAQASNWTLINTIQT